MVAALLIFALCIEYIIEIALLRIYFFRYLIRADTSWETDWLGSKTDSINDCGPTDVIDVMVRYSSVTSWDITYWFWLLFCLFICLFSVALLLLFFLLLVCSRYFV